MARSGPFASRDLHALFRLCGYLLTAGDAARTPGALAMQPLQRWRSVDILGLADALPEPVRQMFVAGSDLEDRAAAFAEAWGHRLAEVGIALAPERTLELLTTGASLITRADLAIFDDEQALLDLEELSNFVNGYLQSMPRRFVPGSHPDEHNRRFRAYQRRRNGIDAPVFSPSTLVRRQAPEVHELFDLTASLLVDEPSAIRRTALALAVAVGRPMDATVVDQFTLTMTVGCIWRSMQEFPKGTKVHPLLGRRPEQSPETWDVALRVTQMTMETLARPRRFSSDPASVQLPSASTVAGATLDGPSLHSLQQLHHYVQAHAAWSASREPGTSDDLRTFHAFYLGSESDRLSIPELVANLAPDARTVVAHANALIARDRPLTPLAQEIAVALGDTSLIEDVELTLTTAVQWLAGRPLGEPSGAVRIDLAEQPLPATVAPFATTRQRDAEALLDLGAAVAELVRFGHSLTDGKGTPEGWWRSLHTRSAVPNMPSSLELLHRLPDRSKELLRAHRALLALSEGDDFAHAPRALASALGRLHEQPCVRTLAVALSVGVAWSHLETSGADVASDTLMGVSPATSSERLAFTRARAQLDWGLQEMLHTDAVIGV
jgi:hypothetical protein